jgi:hypothetical protein
MISEIVSNIETKITELVNFEIIIFQSLHENKENISTNLKEKRNKLIKNALNNLILSDYEDHILGEFEVNVNDIINFKILPKIYTNFDKYIKKLEEK